MGSWAMYTLAAMAELRDWGLSQVQIWSPSVIMAAAVTELWRELGLR